MEEVAHSVKYCTRMGRRLLVAGGFGLAALFAVAAPVGAHPLGNFTVNRYARVEVSGPVIRVYYVLDEAEIPTFQDRDALDADRAKFIRDRTESIRRGLSLTVQHVPVALSAVETMLTLPEGQGGLPTLRIAIRFEGDYDESYTAAHSELVERLNGRLAALGLAPLALEDVNRSDQCRLHLALAWEGFRHAKPWPRPAPPPCGRARSA